MKGSNIHLLPNITVVSMESAAKSNYPVVPYWDYKDCGCACMLEKGSYEPIEGDNEYFYKLDGLFTYDQDID